MPGRVARPILCWIAGAIAAAQSWVPQTSGTQASLRGVSAVSPSVVWASGSQGTYLKTIDGGATWQAATLPGAADLDFRAVRAVDERTVFLLSAGEGAKSRIYKTSDGGGRWALLYTNPDPKGFFDAIAFWDPMHGIVLGDPVDGRFVILTTDDGGENWHREKTPPARREEGAFAASGACLLVRGAHEVWFGTGGTGGARVFHSQDGGKTWSVAAAPIRNDGAGSGMFSLAFAGVRTGVAVGGDYTRPQESARNVATTADGGKTWTAPSGTPPGGFRSAIEFIADRKLWIATGTSGSDISYDDGKNWKQFDAASYNALSFFSVEAGWTVGPNGAIAKFSISPPQP